MSDPAGPIQPPPSPKRWGCLAITLLVIGLLIVVPSGLCTGIFGIGAIYDMMTSSSPSEGMSVLVEALMIGGIPLAIGAALVYAAFKVRTNG